MPFVSIRLYAGHPKERKDEMARRITEVICDVTKLPKAAVWVVFEEIDAPNWYLGGRSGEPMAQ